MASHLDRMQGICDETFPVRWTKTRSGDGVLELARLAYASATAGAGWRGFLEGYRQALGGAFVSMVYWERSTHASTATLGVGPTGPAVIEGYGAYYGRLNPIMRQGTEYMRAGLATPSHVKVPMPELRRTEYFNDFASRLDIECGIGACVLEEEGRCVQIACMRPERLGLYGAAEQRFLEPLMPHLGRALQLHQRLDRLRLDHATEAGVLDCLREALLIVGADARAVLANHSARQLLSENDGLTLTSDGLRAARADETKALRELIAGAARRVSGEVRHPGGVLRVSRPSLRQPLSVLVAPVAPSLRYPRLPPGCVTVMVKDPEGTMGVNQLVALRFGLTRAEARLAGLLLDGHSLESGSEVLGIARETGRTHLKSILRKSGTNRQSEFIRRVAGGAAGQILAEASTEAVHESRR